MHESASLWWEKKKKDVYTNATAYRCKELQEFEMFQIDNRGMDKPLRNRNEEYIFLNSDPHSDWWRKSRSHGGSLTDIR